MKLILAVFGALLRPTSASAQTTFDNRPALQTAADLWCSDETAALAEYGNIADWDVSSITDMTCLFSAYCGGSATGKSTCNPDIGSWDTSAVLYMRRMFWGASSFDRDISSWDTSAVLWMEYLFWGASAFDKDISSWNTSAVFFMSGMFDGATSFDKDISSWDTSAVLYMTRMFYGAISFDKDLSSWNVLAARRMALMFNGASSLSDCNKALIQASFSVQTSAWPSYYNSWGSFAWAAPRWREEARRAIGDVLASSCPPKRSHPPVAPPSAPPRAATVRPPGLAYTG
ncbi:hypothetical protein EMIHUDRAFT_112721 [Emiliania huxleyi CCMP1516]|uniref:Uncharacterized protein n=2 Tax=Emiliania huxleyi TaxID=2903 RepID=A0A0D3K7D5_EMIH1|nr:hypothetical protein EMIHUDRAFT_112721 [Emiliania huxleyi CCMP1516]EOD31670.1 hypothetical protein EMIHUDRAFT_112721 [Emiliania huxleyi CCMP1516]|eukprot:XP_005784099.1 hypothetical protein EMIHUDRAFT_112721 [Emiliania huxleyi CCMP1516]